MQLLTIVLVILLAAPGAAATASGQPGRPAADGVRTAAAPFYNAFLVEGPESVGVAIGEVTVVVVVNAEGAVEEATVVDAPSVPLLESWARAAALKWEFKPTPGSWSRSYRLTFSFDGDKLSDAPRGVQSSYENPLTLHVVYNKLSVVHLDRSFSESNPPRCTVHDSPMTVQMVPVHYGLLIGVSSDDPSYDVVVEYWDAREHLFPNARDAFNRGCIVSSETSAEVLECPACRDAKREWLSDHPDLPAKFY
jgi:TonB family protein